MAEQEKSWQSTVEYYSNQSRQFEVQVVNKKGRNNTGFILCKDDNDINLYILINGNASFCKGLGFNTEVTCTKLWQEV